MLKIVDSSLFLVELIFSEIIIIEIINLKFELFPNFQKKKRDLAACQNVFKECLITFFYQFTCDYCSEYCLGNN